MQAQHPNTGMGGKIKLGLLAPASSGLRMATWTAMVGSRDRPRGGSRNAQRIYRWVQRAPERDNGGPTVLDDRRTSKECHFYTGEGGGVRGVETKTKCIALGPLQASPGSFWC